jgi:hypothetical protein
MKDFFEENVVADPDTGPTLAEEKKFLPEFIVEGIVDCEGIWTGFQSADYLLAGKDVVLKQSLNFFFCHSIHPFAFVFRHRVLMRWGMYQREGRGLLGLLRIA